MNAPMKISGAEEWPLDRIKPYPKNARSHPAAQITLLATMLKRWGADQPIVVDEAGVVLKGHGRLSAAIEAGLKVFPVVQRFGLAETEKRALRIADNQVALLSGWDAELMKFEIGELKLGGFDLNLLGFPNSELSGFLNAGGLTDPDEVPEPPANPVSRLGDLWLLGDHRLICGDSTDAATVEKCLGGAKPHLMVTDPPYGVEFDPTWRRGSEKRVYMPPKDDQEGLWREVWEKFEGDVIYIWHATKWIAPLYSLFGELGFEMRSQIIWNKMRFIIGRGNYNFNHEPCFYGVRKGKTAHWEGGQNKPTVWDIEHKASDTNHGAQKPVECMRRPIENNSKIGDSIYEPFSGSGTTIIAGEMIGRRIMAIEISPAYVDVAVERWQAFSGKIATLEATGKTFAETKAARAKQKRKRA